MKHNTTSAFWKLHDALPGNIRELAKRNYERLKIDTNHPSLHFKKLSGHKHTYASARVGEHYRAVCILTEGDALWFWIGSHETYNKLIKQLS